MSVVGAPFAEISLATAATDIRCYTHIFDSFSPDREGDYAREVGEFLRLPVKCMALDQIQLFEGWDDPEFSLPEPVDDPLFAGFLDTCRTISADCRVLLSGEGVDNLLDFQMWPYAGDLLRNGEWRRLLTDMANYFWIKPFPWDSIRTRMKRIIGKDLDMPVFPPWFNREFCDRAKLKARWKERSEHPVMPSAHPIVPHAHASLSLPRWTQMFERENAGLTPYPLEVRYPFLDLRIVNYLLAIPPFPWFFEKILLREAMAQRIPERLRMRRKTPLAGDPVSAQLQKTGAERLNQIP